MAKMRIGVLTGGGDVPGLNSVIKALTYNGINCGYTMVGIKRGWGGLVYHDPKKKIGTLSMDISGPEQFIMLTEENTKSIYKEGGTVLHTSRVNPAKMLSTDDVGPDLKIFRNLSLEQEADMTDDVMKNIDMLGLDCLVTIGGDDTLSYSVELAKKGINVIGIPKTMDNDIWGTEYAIGFSTAIARATKFVTDLRTCAASHERVEVIDMFGRKAGFVVMETAYSTHPDRIVIPEHDFDKEKLLHLLMEDREKSKSNYSMVLMAEGAKTIGEEENVKNKRKDLYGNIKLGGIGEVFSQYVKEKTNRNTIYQPLTYIIRCGDPSNEDKKHGRMFANMAIGHIVGNDFGKLMAIQDGKYTSASIDIVTKGKKSVDVSKFYDTENYRPIEVNPEGCSALF